jgi:hypothetical protein
MIEIAMAPPDRLCAAARILYYCDYNVGLMEIAE